MHLFTDILLSSAVISHIIIGIFILFKKDRTISHISFALLLFCVSGWVLANVLIDRALTIEYALMLGKISALVNSLSPAFFLYFTYTFSSDRYFSIKHLLLFVPAFFFVPLSLTNAIASGADIMSFPVIIYHGWLFPLYTAYLICYLIFGFLILIYKFKKNTRIVKSQLSYILFGVFSMMFIAVITNLLVPLIFQNYTLTRIGPLSSIVFAIVTAYAIVKYRLFDIQIQLQKILNALIPVLMAMCVTVSLGFILFRYTAIHRLISTFGVLILYTVILNVSRKFILRSQLSYFLFRKTYQYRKALLQLASKAHTILNFTQLTNQILTVFVEDIGSKKAALFFMNTEKKREFDLIEVEGYQPELLEVLVHPSNELFTLLQGQKTVLTIDDIENKIQQEISLYKKKRIAILKNVFEQCGVHIFIPLLAHQAFIGCIVLGDKSGGRVYTIEDIELLNEAAPNLAIALLNCKQHQEKTILARMLQEEVDRAVDAWQTKSKENEELSNIKSQFITVASHQLRTPISVIRNSLQMVLEDYLIIKDNDKTLDAETAKAAIRLLSNAFLASDNLKSTADHILAASEFIGGKPNVHVKKLVTTDFFQTRVQRAQNLLDMTHKPISIQVTIDSRLSKSFVTDERKCAMIIDNIFANAVMYTREGTVSFHVVPEQDDVVITITDTGIGIPKQDQKKLFQRFVRLQNAVSVVPDGSGLGLYLAKKYTELLRGSITFQSEEGKGTTFTIRIPLEYSYVAN